ncbi:MAG: hypothetical protein EON87_20930 [Brevundimonas sp.]|nr:MAG: hypothetical protein EON87_20930 [Brevundimonas sp.]
MIYFLVCMAGFGLGLAARAFALGVPGLIAAFVIEAAVIAVVLGKLISIPLRERAYRVAIQSLLILAAMPAGAVLFGYFFRK